MELIWRLQSSIDQRIRGIINQHAKLIKTRGKTSIGELPKRFIDRHFLSFIRSGSGKRTRNMCRL